MKYRNGFVSNSSSSSFIATLSRLTDDDIKKILEYENSPENTDNWGIHVNNEMGLLEGYTVMCNGAFPEWCEKNGYNKVRFEGGC